MIVTTLDENHNSNFRSATVETSHSNNSSDDSKQVTFPRHCLVGSIGDFAKVMAAGSEVPEEFYFAAGLTVLGHICGDRLSLRNNLKIRPQLYTVLLGESGQVKKSTAVRNTMEFFEKINEASMNVTYGIGSAEGLAEDLESRKDVLMAYDELRSFIDKCSIQSSVLLPMVTSLFEQTNYQNMTKRKNLVVADAHLSLLGCCTSDTYEAMWSPAAIGIGLPNRLFVVTGNARDRVAWPKAKSEARIEELRQRISKQMKQLPVEFDITEEARNKWERWYLAMPASIHATRLDTVGFRLMGLLALIMDKRVIDEEIIAILTAILDYEYRVRVLTDPIDAHNKIAALEQKLRNVLSVAAGQWVKDRELRQRTHAHRTGLWSYEAALKNLQNTGEIESQSDRRSKRHRLLPEEETVATSVATPSVNVNIQVIQ